MDQTTPEQFVWAVLVQNGIQTRATMLYRPEGRVWNIDAVAKAAKLEFELQGPAHLLEVRATNDGPALEEDVAVPPGAAQQKDTPLFIIDPRPSGSTGELFRFVVSVEAV